jgi:D-beta-D-heptose 7-phosphate kinase / D-beta-D-heptose 1-phosphate adenosyltransferase
VITPPVTRELRVCADALPVVIDAKRLRQYRHVHPTACVPSFDEAVTMAGGLPGRAPEARAEAVAAADARILAATGADVVVVTLDADDAVVLEPGRSPHRVYANAVPAPCKAGAADAFTAALTLALLACVAAATAAELAAAAAAVVVGKHGTATCSRAELRMKLLPGSKVVADVAALAAAGERHRREGRRIVLANGCFDILHTGHVALLNAAKACGDVLVVAVNGDDSVRRLKGVPRPVNALADRISVLAALSCVDHIVAFHGDQPVELIRALRPDVLVKGGDYTEDDVPEAGLVRALGGEVRIVDRIPNRSTSATIERLAAQAGR